MSCSTQGTYLLGKAKSLSRLHEVALELVLVNGLGPGRRLESAAGSLYQHLAAAQRPMPPLLPPSVGEKV